MKYELEIYEPDSKLDALQTFKSDTPFMNINKGEILNPAFFDTYDNSSHKLFKVTQVEHIIWVAHGETTQKVLIFTTEIENTPEAKE